MKVTVDVISVPESNAYTTVTTLSPPDEDECVVERVAQLRASRIAGEARGALRLGRDDDDDAPSWGPVR